ncbi:MAG: PASTA domain-containing protein [Ignavibacteria bacterium]
MSFWKKTVIVVVILIGIILLFNNVLMPLYVKQGKLVKVPSVVGLSISDAKKTLDDADLEGIQGDIRYDANKPIGTILDQNPVGEQMVKSGRRIYLVVSGGEQLYDVPNLVGRSVRESKFALAQRNLELQEMDSRVSAQYPSGTIISQIEPAGSKVKKGTKIGVIVSTGMETGDIKVPELIGKNLEEAKKIILQNHMTIGKINYQPNPGFAVNAVIDQYPKGNTLALTNQKIDLFVNKEVKQEIPQKDEEMNSMEEVKPDKEIDKQKQEEKSKDIDKGKKPEPKKDNDVKKDIKKDDKSKQPDKKDDKKKTDKKDNTTNDGTKF